MIMRSAYSVPLHIHCVQTKREVIRRICTCRHNTCLRFVGKYPNISTSHGPSGEDTSALSGYTHLSAHRFRPRIFLVFSMFFDMPMALAKKGCTPSFRRGTSILRSCRLFCGAQHSSSMRGVLWFMIDFKSPPVHGGEIQCPSDPWWTTRCTSTYCSTLMNRGSCPRYPEATAAWEMRGFGLDRPAIVGMRSHLQVLVFIIRVSVVLCGCCTNKPLPCTGSPMLGRRR